MRRRVALSELEVERDEDAAGALAVLTESRLVTVDEAAVEVAHEALLREWPRLRRWLEEDAEGRRLHQHLIHAAAEWHDSEHDPAELYRGARLASALDWAASHDPELNELERAFLEESQAASEREAERQRRDKSAAPDAARRRRRAARRRRHRRRDRALRAPGRARRGHRRDRPASRSASAHRGPPRSRADARQHGRRPRRLAGDPLQPALDVAPEPRRARRPGRRCGRTAGHRPQRGRKHARGRRWAGAAEPVRHRDEAANRRSPTPGRALVVRLRPPGRLARDPHERLARAPRTRPSRSSTRARCGCKAPSRSAPIRPPPDRATTPPPSMPRAGEAWWSAIRPGIATTRRPCSCGVSTPAPAPRSDRPSASRPSPPRSR